MRTVIHLLSPAYWDTVMPASGSAIWDTRISRLGPPPRRHRVAEDGLTIDNGAVHEARRKPLRIVDHDGGWASALATIGSALRGQLAQAALRIDHIGSTAVRGLAAKDVIDIQVTVAHLDVARDWPHEVLPDLIRRPATTADHVPLGVPSDADEWAKLYWSNGSSVHLHVREEGRLNQRYPLLFRDYLSCGPGGRRRVRTSEACSGGSGT